MSGKLVVRVLGSDALPVALPASGKMVLGSSPDRATLVVEGQGVDDAHCAIGVLKGGGWAIKDLGSRYGIVVNGKKVQSARLAEGDTILLGSRRIRIEDPARPAPAEAAPAPAADAAAPAPAAPPTAEPDAAPKKPLPRPGSAALPKQIGGYRIDRLLGKGGMGTVFLAEQVSLHRPVALKVLSPRLAADKDFVRKFQTEARAAAALNHPNVVVVHDVGEADGYHYLSMEVMEKGSLEDRVADGAMPWREVLDVLHDAANGLMFAEEKRIVHRDIKPANLMQNAAGTIKIADLGLATSVEAEATDSEGKKILGTPHFISPEQARGDAVDHRSDLYSLGATAYRLLTGRTPFEGETTRDILRGHFTEEPTPLRELDPAIPAGLEELVLNLLAKDPAERPPSAQALLGRVDRLRLEADHGAGGPLPAAKGGAGSKKGLLVGAAVVALAAAGLLFSGVLGGDDGGTGTGVAAGGPETDPGGAPDGADGPGAPWEPDDSALFQPETPSTAGAEAGAGDGEPDLAQLDLLAENAWLKLSPDLPRAERIARLGELIEEYAGTKTAIRMEGERRDLQAALEAERAEAARLAGLLGDAESKLRLLAELPKEAGGRGLPRPGDQLRQIRSFAPGGELADAPAYAALAASLEDEVVRNASTLFGERLAAADDLAAGGDFDGVKTILEELLPRFDLPSYEAGSEPDGFTDLKLLGDRVRARLARLDAERAAWADHVNEADRELVASELRGDDGVEGALRALDLGTAEAALEGLLARAGTGETRRLVEGLTRDVARVRIALDALVAEHAAGGWRRKAVLDPGGAREAARDAREATAEGIVVDRGGLAELVPWSEFLASPEATSFLFRDRFHRDLTDEERLGVLALARTAAVLHALEIALPVLDPDGGARYSPGEAESLVSAYELAAAWVPAGAGTEAARLDRERAAARLLSRALMDAEDEAWSSTAAALEELLSEYRDTLLVALLSDGSSWREAEPEAEPEDGAAEDV